MNENEQSPVSEDVLEVYRQRYETFRHLDKLRWQMVQISVATAPIILAFGAKQNGAPAWWVYLTAGALLIIFGFVMEKIRKGIIANAVVLSKFGTMVGDTSIPAGTNRAGSTSYLVSVVIRALGGITLVLGFLALWSER